MSDLTYLERNSLEKLFKMGGGYTVQCEALFEIVSWGPMDARNTHVGAVSGHVARSFQRAAIGGPTSHSLCNVGQQG